MDWITGGLLTTMALLVATLWACLRALRELRAVRSMPPPPMERFVVVGPGGAPQGPVDRPTLRAMLIDGRLDDAALAAAIAGEGWRPAAELALGDDDPLAPPDRPGRATTHHLWRH